jgi:hypothetical protein
LVTLSEGEIGELHVRLKGTMNALFLKDLALKTRRGLEGRVRQGKSNTRSVAQSSYIHPGVIKAYIKSIHVSRQDASGAQ